MLKVDYLKFYKELRENKQRFDPLEESLFERIKDQKCNLCEFNINIPADVVCDDCPHMRSRIPREGNHLRESFSKEEERKTRKEEIHARAAANKSFICAACGREYHKHYEWPITDSVTHCIDCVKTLVECHSVLGRKTGLAEIMKLLNRNHIVREVKVDITDADTEEKLEKIKDNLYGQLMDILRKNMSAGFYSEYKHTAFPDGRSLGCKLEYYVLTPLQYKSLIAKAFEKDHYTDEKLLNDWLKSGRYKESDVIKSVEAEE